MEVPVISLKDKNTSLKKRGDFFCSEAAVDDHMCGGGRSWTVSCGRIRNRLPDCRHSGEHSLWLLRSCHWKEAEGCAYGRNRRC